MAIVDEAKMWWARRRRFSRDTFGHSPRLEHHEY